MTQVTRQIQGNHPALPREHALEARPARVSPVWSAVSHIFESIGAYFQNIAAQPNYIMRISAAFGENTARFVAAVILIGSAVIYGVDSDDD